MAGRSPTAIEVFRGARAQTLWGIAIEVCGAARAYDLTGRAAKNLAWALLLRGKDGDRVEARWVAEAMLLGPQRAAGHVLLATLDNEDRDSEGGAGHAERALALTDDPHTAQQAMMARGEAIWRQGRWQDALESFERASALARVLRDGAASWRADVAVAKVMRSMGDDHSAEDVINVMLATSDTACDLIWPRFERGLIELADQRYAQAVASFEEARHVPRGCAAHQTVDGDSVRQNLAAARLELGQLDEATAELDQLEPSVSVSLNRARIADRRGDQAAVARWLATAQTQELPSANWAWEVWLLQAQADEVAGDLVGAVRAYRRAIDEVATLRQASRGSDGFAVAQYRGVYDGLVALYARQARWRDALEIVLALDASDMLRSTRTSPRGDAAPAGGAAEPKATAPAMPTVEDVLAAWRGRELAIVIAVSERDLGRGGERAYRLMVRDGQVAGADVGDAAQVRDWARTLFATPDDVDAARGLGAIVAAGATTDRPLDVVLVGPLGMAPLAALRDDAGLLIERRPLARVLSIRPRPAGDPAHADPVILADPQGNLPGARFEGVRVAAGVGVEAFTQAAATTDRLWSARRADLLHLATHVDEGTRQRVLRLADREVTAAEIVEHGLAPRLVVLASCGAAAAHDEEGWGSLAQAFLVAGSDYVIAADVTVDDAETAALIDAFYGDPRWRTEPTRALAAAQAGRAVAQPSGAWSRFTLLAAPPRGTP